MGTCAGVPQQTVDADVKVLLDQALARAFRGGIDGRQIAEAIALDAPVDLVLTLDTGRRGQPDALFAFSVGLTSLERVRGTLEAAGPLVDLVPGLWRVGTKVPGEMTCVVGPAAGVAPARLICGRGDKDVSALGPYLARNVPVAAPPARDIHAELRFTTIEARYGSEIRRGLTLLPGLAASEAIGEPRFDKALHEAAAAVADEAKALLTDLDKLTVDIGVDGGGCLTATGALQLRGKSSWIAGLIDEGAGQQGPPPPIFWRAPVDSAAASYGRGSDPARYAGILRVLRGLAEGKLAKEQVGSDADRKALVALIANPLGKGTNVVSASGQAQSPPKPAAGTSSRPQQLADAISTGLGWYLLGFDEGPAALSKLLKDIVSVYGRKGLMDPVRKAARSDAELLPTVKLVPAPAQLGPGALDVEIHIDTPALDELDPKKKPKKEAGLTLHVLLMGEAKSTWIAFGASRDELVRRLLSVKAGAPDSGTLASRPGLEPLRAGKAVSSGFVTVGTFTRIISAFLLGPLSTAPTVGEIVNTLNNLPHKGDTPIFLTSTATPAGPRSEFVVNLQKGSFEDLGAVLMTLHRIATNQGLLSP
jgi:hypothetical protein